MRKKVLIPIALILILVFVLSGCKKKTIVDDPVTKPVDKPVVEAPEDEKQDIMSKFNNLIENKDDLEKIASYINEKIDKLNQLDGNRMIDALERSLELNIGTYTDKILKNNKDGELMKIAGNEIYFPEEKVKEISNKKLKEEVTKAFNNMYKLVNTEGEFYTIIDYSKLKKYNNNITDEWKEYLAIRAMDSDDIPFVDAAIRISFADLSDRIIKTENFLNKYIDSDRQEEMLDIYKNKLTAYMKGLPNTPISDSQTKKISKDVLDSYNQTSNIEGYVTQNIIYKYMELIKANNFVIDDRILKEADTLIAEAVEILEEYK